MSEHDAVEEGAEALSEVAFFVGWTDLRWHNLDEDAREKYRVGARAVLKVPLVLGVSKEQAK